jgi:histidine phosphotransferase ChpT
MIQELEFAELVCARYSHDLAGPIGAIGNGVEFLECDAKDIREKAIELVKSSAEQAVVRLQFFRQVYGYIRGDSEMSLSDIMSLADKFYSLTKMQLKWDYNQNNESLNQFKARHAKLIFNALNIVSNILVLSGEIKVTMASSKNFHLEIKGDKIIYDDYLLDVLTGELDMVEVNTKNIHIYYFTRIVKDLGMKVNITTGVNNLILSIAQ